MHETFPEIIPATFHFKQVSKDVIKGGISMLKSHQDIV